MTFWVYILRCADGSYYTGHTDNLEKRIGEHQDGACNGYTRDHRPVELIWSQEATTREEALTAEIQIKGWGRKKKEAMMRGDWQEVNKLGRGKHRHQRKQPPCILPPTLHASTSGAAPPTLHASTSGAAPPTLSTNGGGRDGVDLDTHYPVRPEPFGYAQDKLRAAKSRDIILTEARSHLHLGLDFGTSGARACIIDGARSVVWERRTTWPEPAAQTPADWHSALLVLLGALPRDLAARLQGIAVGGTSGTVLLCDESLAPLSPALLYNDTRAQPQAAQIERLAPQAHAAHGAASGLAKFLWLTQQPEAGQAAYFLHQADWLAALLGGEPGISDWHNALKTGYDVEALRWPDWIMALPHAHLLPEVVAPGSDIGTLHPNLAARFGIAPSCIIHAGTTDSTAAFIASGVSETGIGVTSLGTTLVLKQLLERRIEAPQYGIYSHRYGDLWLVGGASNAGAGVLRRFFDDAQLTALSAQIDPMQDSPLDYYPLPAPGERFPVSDPELAPRLEPRPPDDAAFLHGLLQGLSRIEAAGYARLAELGAPPLRRVLTSGGGARNETWRKLRERLLGVPVGTAPHAEAAYGCALLCCNSTSNCSSGNGLPNR